MIEKLQTLNAELEEMKRQNAEKSKALFSEISKHIFAENPSVEKFSWDQYTPYFNDGDECTFSVNEYSIKINDDIDEDTNAIRDTIWDSDKKEYISNGNVDTVLQKGFQSVRELVTNVSEDAMRQMFGDHVQITIYRNGHVEIEEHAHD